MAVHRRTGGRAPTRGRAPGMHGRVPPVHGTAGFSGFCLGCMAVHPCGTPVRSPIFLGFAILGGRGFLEPLIFPKIARKVFFSIET